MSNNIFETDKNIRELISELKRKLRVYAKSDNMPKKFIFICGKQKNDDRQYENLKKIYVKYETEDRKIF